MSDNFGTLQSRVLDVDGRNLNNVVFQETRQCLTSELNLINQIASLKQQQGLKAVMPSGWLKVDTVEDTNALNATDYTTEQNAEDRARSGQILTSKTYAANSFKLVSRNESNVAVVNGWPLVISGSSSSDDNNVITLPPPSGSSYRYDLVFLEVWKKLIGENDNIYPYGNTQAIPFVDNEIVWDRLGYETTKRVQIQYRIRTYISSNYTNCPSFEDYPEGLGSSLVKAIGGNSSGSYTSLTFTNFGSEDPGLYIAGTGSDEDKETLNTVDGYVYAIPMYIVYRRAESDFGSTQTHGAGINQSELITGFRSDRPDALYLNIVANTDIIDIRHQIVTSGQQLDSIAKRTFRKLIAGELTTAKSKGFGASGVRVVNSGGSKLLKLEQVNGNTIDAPNIGSGVGVSDFKKRVYANCAITKDNNIIAVPANGSSWIAGAIAVSSFIDTTNGTVSSSNISFYAPVLGALVTGITCNGTTVTIAAGSNMIGQSSTVTLYMQFTYEYNAGNNGLKDVPKEFYEISKDVRVPIATRDNDVLLRADNSLNPLQFDTNGICISDAVTNEQDYVHYCGGQYTENYNFGHDLVVFRTLNSGTSISITCNNEKLNGYTILGVKSVQAEGTPGFGNYGSNLEFTIQRITSGTTIVYSIGIISTLPSTPCKLKISLYTGSGSSVADSIKFFEMSKQGRGITDIYEMIEVTATEDSFGSGNFWIDTGDKPIIAIAARTLTQSGFTIGKAYGYYNVGLTETLVDLLRFSTLTADLNENLPVSGSPTDVTMLPTRIKVSAAAAAGTTLKVPVLVHSYVSSGESAYNIFYKLNPYQGILNSVKYGRIESEAPAVITSEGSGAITDYTYTTGTCTFVHNNRVITGLNTLWVGNILAGDYVKVSSGTLYYRILRVDNNTQITLAEPFAQSTALNVSYEIIRLDTPANNISNLIDRMPTYTIADYTGESTPLDIAQLSDASVYETSPKVRRQDPLDTITNDFILGSSSKTNSRGRYNMSLTLGKNDSFKLGFKTPEIFYENSIGWTSASGTKKVFQAYLFNESIVTSGKANDLTGKIYLLVIGSENSSSGPENKLTSISETDVVELFELEGRPIIKSM